MDYISGLSTSKVFQAVSSRVNDIYNNMRSKVLSMGRDLNTLSPGDLAGLGSKIAQDRDMMKVLGAIMKIMGDTRSDAVKQFVKSLESDHRFPRV
jgi:hypothetical protein